MYCKQYDIKHFSFDIWKLEASQVNQNFKFQIQLSVIYVESWIKSIMLSVIYVESWIKSIMLSVIMLSVIMLSVIMLRVILLNVMAPVSECIVKVRY